MIKKWYKKTMKKEHEKALETLAFVCGTRLLSKKERRERLLSAAIAASRTDEERAIDNESIRRIAKELGYPTSYEEWAKINLK